MLNKDRIGKSSLSFRMKFWWAIVILRLMLTEGDDKLKNQRAVLVASMIEGLNIDFGHIIADELFIRAHKMKSTLPFPCLIIEMCRQANVPLLRGVDNED